MTSSPTKYCCFVLAALLLFARPVAAYWSVESIFSAPGEANEASRFGSALEISGSTIIVGAEATDEAEKSDVGAVYSYERDALNQWSLTQIFRYPNEPAGSGIGHTLAVDGNVLLVPVISSTASRVIVYQRTAPGALWTEAQALSGDQADERFGQSVAVRGDTIVVGAEQSGSGLLNQDRAGAAYVFARMNPGAAWSRVQKITAPPAAGVNSYFGSDVELDGAWLTVGARSLSLTPNQSGVTFVYHGVPGAYELRETLAPDSFYSGSKGWETTHLRDGLLLIGSPDERNPADTAQAWGAVFAWDVSAGTLGPAQKIERASRTGTPRFGSSVTAADDVMAIGVPIRSFSPGVVFLWSRNGVGAWSSSAVINPVTNGNAYFGHRVAMAESNRVAIAAPGRSDYNLPGSVYVYREGDTGPFVMASTSPATHIGTYRAQLNAVVRSSGVSNSFFFDYGKTTAYELGFVAALPEGLDHTDAVYIRRDLDGRQFPRLESDTLYHYRVRGGGVTGLDCTFTTASFDPSLGEAVESPALNWESYGQKRWRRQTATTWDGSDAMEISGLSPFVGYSYLETSVIGPGSLSFRWKVSSLPSFNVLGFRDNETVVKFITGTVDWTLESVRIPAGTRRIAWRFDRGTSGGSYLETAWVDTITWIPDNPANGWMQWRTSSFTHSQLANPAVSGPTADPDGDGLKNVVEAHFGSPPLVPGSNPTTATSSAAGGTLTLLWPEADPLPGTVAVPEWSPDGTVWLTSGQSFSGIPPRIISVSYARGNKKQAVLSSSGLSRGFLRLRVVAP